MTSILGIETSCDETAAAVVDDGHDIRSSVVSSMASDIPASRMAARESSGEQAV